MNHGGHPDAMRLQALVDGELSAEERAELEAHCRGCETCRLELAALAAVSDALTADADADEPPRGSVWPAVACRLERDRGFSPAFLCGMIGVCLVGVVLGVLSGAPESRDASGSAAGRTLQAGQIWSTGDAQPSPLDIFTPRRTTANEVTD